MAHRVAWLLFYGAWPIGVIDHIDCVKDNNTIINLRDCSYSQNMARRRMAERKLPRGVTFAAHTNKKNPYMAQIKNKSIGYFPTPEAASAAYEERFLEVYGAVWRY